MNKIDLSHVRYLGGAWGGNSPARRSWAWLCEKTGHDRWLDHSRTIHYLVDDRVSPVKNPLYLLNYAKSVGAKSFSTVRFQEGTGWRIVTYSDTRLVESDDHQSDDVLHLFHVLIEDDALAVEFKLIAPWESNE